jgi:hypothetical protein
MVGQEQGLKYDNDKLRWDLLPIAEVEEVVKILTFGAKKYAPNNWQLVNNAKERYYAAIMRHMVAYRKGELIDPESGLPHLAHAMCNIMFLMWFDKNEVKKETEIIDALHPWIKYNKDGSIKGLEKEDIKDSYRS